MANQPLFTPPLVPYTIADLKDDINYLEIPETVLQLQVDALNVLENRVSIDSFTPERQQTIKDYYRFSATQHNDRSQNKIAKRIMNTLELI